MKYTIKIYNYINESSVKLAVNSVEESLKEKFSKELLSYMPSFSKFLKPVRYFVKKNRKEKKEDIYWWACKKKADNKKIMEVALVNKTATHVLFALLESQRFWNQ